MKLSSIREANELVNRLVTIDSAIAALETSNNAQAIVAVNLCCDGTHEFDGGSLLVKWWGFVEFLKGEREAVAQQLHEIGLDTTT